MSSFEKISSLIVVKRLKKKLFKFSVTFRQFGDSQKSETPGEHVSLSHNRNTVFSNNFIGRCLG